jgi:predicted RecB family nuclease
MNMVEAELDSSLETVPGIGPRTKEKLNENSIETILDLAAAIPNELQEILGGKEVNAASPTRS